MNIYMKSFSREQRLLVVFVIALFASISTYFYCGYQHQWVKERVSPFAALGPGKAFGTTAADRGNFILMNYPQFQAYALYSTVGCALAVMLIGLRIRDMRRTQEQASKS